jgi:hypothetical protein
MSFITFPGSEKVLRVDDQPRQCTVYLQHYLQRCVFMVCSLLQEKRTRTDLAVGLRRAIEECWTDDLQIRKTQSVEEASFNLSDSFMIQDTRSVPPELVFHINELSNTLHCASKCIIPDQDFIEAPLPHDRHEDRHHPGHGHSRAFADERRLNSLSQRAWNCGCGCTENV